MFKIVLDAGHGINTAGKRCMKALDPNETREWVLNSRICNKIEQKLKAYDGYSLLRVDDTTGKTDIPLAERCKKANNFGGDLYLSMHHNAGIKGGNGGGLVVFTWNNPSTQLKEWQKLFYNNLIAKTGLKGNRSQPLSKSNFYVLVNTKMPALLFEHGFMDSKTDVPIILSESFAEKCAEAHVESLVKIGGLTKKPVAQTPTTNGKLYRVQVGAYSIKNNAVKMRDKLKGMGFDAVIVNGKLYRVQVGAYSVRENAVNMQNKLKSKGFEAIIV